MANRIESTRLSPSHIGLFLAMSFLAYALYMKTMGDWKGWGTPGFDDNGLPIPDDHTPEVAVAEQAGIDHVTERDRWEFDHEKCPATGGTLPHSPRPTQLPSPFKKRYMICTNGCGYFYWM